MHQMKKLIILNTYMQYKWVFAFNGVILKPYCSLDIPAWLAYFLRSFLEFHTHTTLRQINPCSYILQVSWIRRRDWHILSAGTKVFTKDARFQLLHPGGSSSEWTLVVKFLQQRDEGTYVCQVSLAVCIFCLFEEQSIFILFKRLCKHW
jgi:hypothetical protein